MSYTMNLYPDIEKIPDETYFTKEIFLATCLNNTIRIAVARGVLTSQLLDKETKESEISLTTKLTERTVRDIIKRLVVKHNIPIVGVRCGVFSGYFIPANKGELLDGAKAFYNQVQEESKRLAVLMNSDLESYKETLKEVSGYV
ncbi:hypothetical protein [Streptococcus pneumoniae]|uniref:hypothetical protein n=1 Tax=Streptococcus pneumoniae TaxID=1313 RepID=UPI0005DFB67E|nr:hypothetical protein [Streptococcus pneumoniae]CEW44103.1 phage protein [Streptococcus pneumoniae]CIT40784.1 phage protein [Streptococcus pneumoniae]CIU94301.1 phage protein [Streptococcus pneumoniae]CIZ91189.1 phage protein [Streptococcus pneumoniae]CIZ94273.1 phage protein [Streptococcus pneumoniae]